MSDNDKFARRALSFNIARVLCLDLDGTVRGSKSGKTFLAGPDDVDILSGVYDKIWNYYDVGFLIVGVTNQGGVAHGFKTVEQHEAEVQRTLELLQRDGQDPFNMILGCLSDPKGKVVPFNLRSLGRKPSYGMLAVFEHLMLNESCIVIDWDKSLFVGDREEDAECAEAAKIPFFWAWEFFGRERPANAPFHVHAGSPWEGML